MATALLIDIVVIIVCTSLLVGSGRLSLSHPAVIYLGFHILVVTLRLIGLTTGALPLFTLWGPKFEALRLSELRRAAVFADVTLVAMTGGFLRASAIDRKRHPRRPPRIVSAVDSPPTLSLRHIQRVVMFTLPIGAVSLLLFARFPQYRATVNVQSGLGSSGWVFITTSWLGLSLLALIYWYGFRKTLILPMCAYLAIMMLQGGLRFRFVIPTLLLVMISLDRRGLRWPTKWTSTVLLVTLALFFPLKAIGEQIQRGGSSANIRAAASRSLSEAVRGQNDDQQVFDELASTLTLADRRGVHYYGRIYLGLVTLPIPHQLWPGKPGLADYVKDYSTPARPMFQLGSVTTFIGEAYLNFWYPGILLIPFFLALGLGRLYFTAYRRHYLSVYRFFYLLVACSLVQVYRDGLVSIVFFVVVQMMPLTMILILHRLRPAKWIVAEPSQAVEPSSPTPLGRP